MISTRLPDPRTPNLSQENDFLEVDIPSGSERALTMRALNIVSREPLGAGDTT
jgi:hypothetical protein